MVREYLYALHEEKVYKHDGFQGYHIIDDNRRIGNNIYFVSLLLGLKLN